MLPKILISDLNKRRERRIYEQLERRAAGRYEVFQLTDEPAETDFDLILCPESKTADHHKLSPDAVILTWEQEFKSPLLVSEIDQRLAEQIEAWRQREHSLPEGKNAGLALVFCFDHNLKERWVPAYLKALQNQGVMAIYLPLMPLYRVPDLEEHQVGPQLTDLLLSLDQVESAISRNIGHYLIMHKHGYHTFRLPQQADDLISCPPHLLRKLLLEIKDYISQLADPALALIDCEGLGLETTVRLAQLCDILYIDAVTAESGRGIVARRELAKFLAALPSSVNFRVLNEVKL
ncbi:MAG: hypothetical protein ACOYEL_00380 [Saccharofermentanales bacterium]|jgi:hypothetical protein